MINLITAIVVDDDVDTTEVFAEFLELKNIQVLGKGHDGKDAVDLYKKLNPDVVFLDVMMPYHDGFYGLEKIKQLNPNACVILVTGDLTSETEKRLHVLGGSAIIYKPFDIDDIMETITQVLKEKICNMVLE